MSLLRCFIGGCEFVVVEVFLLSDVMLFLIFSFLPHFLFLLSCSLDGHDQVSTTIRKHNII